jgi:hypothetical protein
MSLPQIQQHRAHEPASLRIIPATYLVRNTTDKVLAELLMCSVCGYIEQAQCLHVYLLSEDTSFKWNEEGTKLTCIACGCDGT